jgi:predicted nicotinamide N-methyase
MDALNRKNFIFNYDLNILKEIIKVLKLLNYKKIQFLSPNQSYLAIAKEHENLINYLFKKKHLLFYYSLFPGLYRFLLPKKLCTCIDICFFNKKKSKEEFLEIFSHDLINKALKNKIILENESKYQFTLSFLPYDDYIFLRETNNDYDDFYTDPEITGHPEFDNRVWVGADSVIFLRYLKKILGNQKFKRGIEIGSGTGIVSIVSSQFTNNFEAIDYNKRAVQFSKLNILLNEVKGINSTYSNMYENVKGKFDLILSVPWFVDIKKSGLEEVPFIFEGLNSFLEDEGCCLITLNSYVKNGIDENIEFLKRFIKKNNYSVELHTIGYQIERQRYQVLKKYNVDYIVSYFAVIKKSNIYSLKINEVSLFRKIRDFTFIHIYKFFNK